LDEEPKLDLGLVLVGFDSVAVALNDYLFRCILEMFDLSFDVTACVVVDDAEVASHACIHLL